MDKRDIKLVAVVAVFWAILFLIMTANRADARVTLSEPAAYSVGSDGCSMYVDGCAFSNQMSGVSTRDADVERSYYLSIKDGVAMGIDAFGLDMTANTTHSTWLLARMSAAMKKYNGENASAKKCIFVSYRAAGGEALNMFNAADSNNSTDSPYCAVDGKPLIGVKQVSANVDPLPSLTGKGPFVVLGTASNATDGVPTKVAVDTWKASGASKVIAYPDAAADMTMSATAKATAVANGASFAYGIPSSWARQCGGPECKGPAAPGYTFRDGKGFLAATAALQASLRDPSASVVFPFAFPGKYDEDVSWESAKICDANDTVAKSGFTCSTLPAHLRGTIPTGNSGLSFSNKSFSKSGFTNIGRWWADKFKGRADPASKPFLAWSYREHPLLLTPPASALTLRKSWAAPDGDFTAYTPAGSEFTVAQVPWNRTDMSVGDVWNTTALDAPNKFLRMRNVTGPLAVNSGNVKGSASITFGDHFDLRPSVRPLGDGAWSNSISELKVSVGGTKTSSTTGGYARALQIHGFRTAYTGSDWLNLGTTRGETYDIQVRYRTAGDYPDSRVEFGGWQTPYSRVKLGAHTWDFIRWDGGWSSDLGFAYFLVDPVTPGVVPAIESISDVDMKAIVNHALADANARLGRNDAAMYIRGVQAWVEPRNGSSDITTEGMTVRYNGTTYGSSSTSDICPNAGTAVVDAKSLSGGGADSIYLTSYSADPVRVRASIGSTVLGTYTLPARQLDLETDARQISIPLGANRGRPKFEVLDSAGNIIAARDGDVTYTDTPTQRSGTGRNVSVYADSMPIPIGTSAAKASVVKVSADRAEGNSGTSVSTFRVTLDKPAPANSTVNWAVSSTAANATDFYQIEETDDKPTGPQCSNVSAPSPASASGFTKLAFCEDFSSPSRVNTSTNGALSAGQTFTQVTSGNIFNAAPMPQSAFVFNADGTMTVTPTRNNYQINMISTKPTGGGGFTGYALPTGGNWYWEARWKHDDCSGNGNTGGFPALWSMSHLKIYANTANTYEPDMYEYIDRARINCLHFYPTAGNNSNKPPIQCKNGSISNVTSFFTSGARASGNGSRYEWFLNNSSLGFVTPAHPADFAKGRYPLMFGSGVPGGKACKYTIDFVRAWERP